MRGFIDRRMRYSDVVVIAAVVMDIKGIMIEEGGVVVGVDVAVVVDVVVMEVDIKVIGKITTLMTTASSGSGSSGSKKMDLEGQGWAGIGSGREMRGEEGSEGGCSLLFVR
jgi:hypothetical protein